MIRLLMASTAVAALLATGAIAQDASSSAPMDTSTPSMSDSSMMDSSSMSSMPMDASSTPMDASSAPMDNDMAAPTPRTPVQILSGYTRADTDNLATKIIGRPVYDGTGTDANNLGNVTDLVVDQSGNVSAVVLGVGGFLGMGQKQVAVDFAALQWVVADDKTERYVLKTTKDELTQAPDFQAVDDQPGDATTSSAVDNGGAMAPATPTDSSSSAAQ